MIIHLLNFDTVSFIDREVSRSMENVYWTIGNIWDVIDCSLVGDGLCGGDEAVDRGEKVGDGHALWSVSDATFSASVWDWVMINMGQFTIHFWSRYSRGAYSYNLTPCIDSSTRYFRRKGEMKLRRHSPTGGETRYCDAGGVNIISLWEDNCAIIMICIYVQML